jgi:hypothetical protein
MTVSNLMAGEIWPSLPLEAWSDTYATLHLWTQIVGKIRLAQSPWTNHSWHVTLYVTPTGLTTGSIPYGSNAFQIDFNFVEHELRVQCDRGGAAAVPLKRQSVAVFYRRLMEEMEKLDLKVRIHPKPNEIPNPIPFDQDEVHASYDPEYAKRFWRVLLQCDRVFKIFRARFVGKCSPVHFFWGAPDLAVTRFSGRLAPPHPGGGSQSSGSSRARSLFARGQQLRLLARRRPDRLSCVLFLRLSGTGRFRQSPDPTGGRVLQQRSSGVYSSLRRSPQCQITGRYSPRFPPDNL